MLIEVGKIADVVDKANVADCVFSDDGCGLRDLVCGR